MSKNVVRMGAWDRSVGRRQEIHMWHGFWPLTKPGVESTKCPLNWVMQSKAVISSAFCFEWLD